MSTGPITLFDKSFIQSLSINESVWFDNFYYTVVCPIFYAETLADLSKNTTGARTAEREVTIIAAKFPDLGGNPCVDHSNLVLSNLLGHDVIMDGRIVVPAGYPVRSSKRTGYVFKSSPEAEAFNRWQKGDFKSVEQNYARAWREAVTNLDLKKKSQLFQQYGLDTTSCRSLEESYQLAVEMLASPKPYEQMALAFLFLNIPRQYHESIVKRWQIMNLPPIHDYAPYASFVLTIEIFFQLAVASSLISADRPSNRIDIAYLFYLPFCMLFVSSDKLHRKCAPLFMRKDQEFVWGIDLKKDLARLDARYSELPEKVKEMGVISFASTPPHELDFLTTQLWDRHMSNTWRDRQEIVEEMPNSNKNFVKELKEISDSAPLSPDKVDFDLQNADTLSIHRRVRRTKGNWLQVPKDLKDEES